VRVGEPRRLPRLGAAALVTVMGMLLAACGGRSPVPSSAAWVATGAALSEPGSAVTPVDLRTGAVGVGVPVGSLPSAMAFTPSGALLVVSQGDNTLSEIAPNSDQVVHSVTVGLEPDAVAVAPGGKDDRGIALVANLDGNSVTPVDLGTWKAGKPIPVGTEPVAIAVDASSPTAGTVFVADFGSNAVTPIDLAELEAGPPIPVGLSPETAAVAGADILVGNFGDHTLTPINAVTLQAAPAVALPFNPTGIVATMSGTTAYLCGGAGFVALHVASFTLGTPVVLPGVAEAVALNRGGTTAWVALRDGDVVTVDVRTGVLGRTVHVGGHPSAVAIYSG
jgi:hyaluronoglucosaminidase